MTISRKEFDEFKEDVEMQFSDIYNRLDTCVSHIKGLEKALTKIMKKDYSYSSIEERDRMIVAAHKFANWSRKELANVFNLSVQSIGKIVNHPRYSSI